MNHNNRNIKVGSLMARTGLRADKVPRTCQIADCNSGVSYLLMDYNDKSFYPRGVCKEHAMQYRKEQLKREGADRVESKGVTTLPKGATCSICNKPQTMNDYNLATCPNGHINAKTVKKDGRCRPRPRPTNKFLRVDGTKGYIKKSDLPPRLVRAMEGWGHYQDGRYGDTIDVPSEFAPDYDNLTMESIHEWWEDQKPRHDDIPTLDKFVEKWGLHFDMWLIVNCADMLFGLKEIRIEVYE
jgi:hypothetical protein